MIKGAGDPNKDEISTLKHGHNYSHKNRATYWRMVLFNCPLAPFLFSNWF